MQSLGALLIRKQHGLPLQNGHCASALVRTKAWRRSTRLDRTRGRTRVQAAGAAAKTGTAASECMAQSAARAPCGRQRALQSGPKSNSRSSTFIYTGSHKDMQAVTGRSLCSGAHWSYLCATVVHDRASSRCFSVVICQVQAALQPPALTGLLTGDSGARHKRVSGR